jgi:predicted ATPase
MAFHAEMIVPRRALDDLGQTATASSTFLRYRLRLAMPAGCPGGEIGAAGERLEIREERLDYVTQGDAHRHLAFPHTAGSWRDSVVINRRHGEGYVSTGREVGETVVRLHQDGGGSRGPLAYRAATLPRTVLSSAGAAESPTALVARREMQSWRLLQLEPSALRRPDGFGDPASLGGDGSHLAATLHRLERAAAARAQPAQSYAEVAGRLAELLDDVRRLRVDRDELRELLTLRIATGAGSELPAAALSDGTLRFLALAVLELDPEATGVLCLEEPENGVHPRRIGALLAMLQRIAVDPDAAAGDGNPLRQVVVNTHSPAVVMQVPQESLLMAAPREHLADGRRWLGVTFRPLVDTWRDRGDGPDGPDGPEGPDEPERAVASLGELLSYLNPAPTTDELRDLRPEPPRRRVVDRDDVQRMLPFGREP